MHCCTLYFYWFVKELSPVFKLNPNSELLHSPPSNKIKPKPFDQQEILFNLPIRKYNITQPCYTKDLCIPAVISPGMMKSGTTTLFYSLAKHPQIAVTEQKELNYYYNHNLNSSKSIERYAMKFKKQENFKIRIDCSPKYMLRPESAKLIYDTNPAVKFIVIFRDPVARSYSHFRYQERIFNFYNNGTCANRTEITFKQYLAEEFKILAKCGLIYWNLDFPLVN